MENEDVLIKEEIEKIPELLGGIEFSREIGWPRKKFATYLLRGKVPKPAILVGRRPFWTRRQVDQYLQMHGEELRPKVGV